MAMEEITLSVPRAIPDGRWHRQTVVSREPVNPHDRVVGRYRRLLRERNRIAWTRHGRRKRHEAFEVAYRSLVKQLAKDVSDTVGDRAARLDIRTRIYGSLTGIVAVSTEDQGRLRDQAVRLFGWGVVLAGVGLTALAATVYLRL
jgi:hypothetical protein